MRKILLSFLTFLILIFQTNFCLADNAKETGEFVERLFQESISIARNNSLTDKQKEKKLSKLVDENVDTNWIARFVIGKYWRQISKKEQQEFIELYQSYLIKVYAPKFYNYGGGDIKIKKIIQQKEKVFFVQAEFDDEQGGVVGVDFRIVKKNGDLLITDFIAEGISFIVTQRSEINSTISNKGFDNFMEHLREMEESA